MTGTVFSWKLLPSHAIRGSQYLNCLFGFLTEPVEFSFLAQVTNSLILVTLAE